MDLEIVLITGMAGSGKSVALHALEDAGYYCVDNLPTELLMPLTQMDTSRYGHKLAVAMDARSPKGLPQLPGQLQQLKRDGAVVHSVFLDAGISTLVRRFSETRRRHPLSSQAQDGTRLALVQTIESERELLEPLRECSHVIDTSNLRAAQLQSYIKNLIALPTGQMTLVFQSFGFKYGLPVDADYVFDVRMLPNPYYEESLRPFTGMDQPVIDYLEQAEDVRRMRSDIIQFLDRWLDVHNQNHRSYVTVAIGCTGGQHRSVYLVEQLANHYLGQWTTLRRHREMDKRNL